MKKTKLLLILSVMVVALVATSCGNSGPYSGVNFDDYIKVAKYKGLPKMKLDTKVTDKEVNDYIKNQLKAKGTVKEVKKGTVKKGDTVNIDYVGKINGKKFDNGSAEGQDLKIGSNSFIPGFEKQLIGKQIGKMTVVKVKFPKNYGAKKLAGKPATFDVKINFVKKEMNPPLNDKFVKSVSKKAKTVKEYKAIVKAKLTKEKKASNLLQQKEMMLGQVINSSEIKKDKDGKEKYPEEELKNIEEDIMSFYEERAKQQKMELKEFVKTNFNMDLKTFKKESNKMAKTIAKQELVYYYILDKENKSLSDDEYDNFIKGLYKKYYGTTEEEFKKNNDGKTLEEIQGKPMLERMAVREKVKDIIYKAAK